LHFRYDQPGAERMDGAWGHRYQVAGDDRDPPEAVHDVGDAALGG